MAGIGGNLKAVVQVKQAGTRTPLGERIPAWAYGLTLTGWLDLSSGDSSHTVFNAKVEQSTHIFLCNYQELVVPAQEAEREGVQEGASEEIRITSENARMVIDGELYEILLIDDPMHLHEQLEIYLKYTGGQNGGYVSG